MRLTVLLVTVSLLGAYASGICQSVTLTGKDLPLKTIFNAIRKQTGYVVFSSKEVLDQTRPVTVSVENMPLKDFLDLTLKNQPVTYYFKGKTVILSRKLDKLTPSQESDNINNGSTIDGQVKDADGKPLAGATIRVKGKGITVVTDESGRFSIRAAAGDVLEVSYVGFLSSSFTVKQQNNIEIVLQAKQNVESEVIVSTGYQRLPRERAAGSFGVMGQEALEKRSNLNILTYLEGQVPGLLMGTDGRITIRGQSTLINANKDPLIVLDGFPIERSIETINATDVESITVLKDASAASIWGVRAANGVIVIQTKRGSSVARPLEINFSSTLSVTPVPDLADLPFASTTSFIEYEKYRVDNNFTFFTGTPRPAISQVVDAYLNKPATAASLADSLKKINAYDEFKSLFMAPATRQQYALAVSGRGIKSTHRGSFSYDKQSAVFKKNTTERFVADLFETMDLTSALQFNMGLNFVMYNTKNNGLGISDIRNLLPYQRILGDNGEYIPQPQTFYQADKENYVKAGYPYNWNYNVMQEFNNKDNKILNNNINAVAGLNYRIIKGLMANIGYQYESGNTTTTNLYNEETYQVRNMVNSSTTVKNNVMVSGIPKGSLYRENISRFYSHTFRGQLRIDRSFNNKHDLSAIAGAEIRELGSKSSSQTKYGYDPQSLQFARVDYTKTFTNIRGSQQLIPDETVFRDDLNRFVSLFSNAGYTYNDKYTLNASARLDKTNLFGSSKKYRNVWLWSAGVNWQLHKENFFNLPAFNSLILRATYGINGNVDRSTSPFLIANVATDQQTNQLYAFVNNPANPLLRWEKTTVTNLGIDFGMFNQRLKGSIEYYNKNSTDLLGNATVNGTYGFNSAFINYASLRNKGVDVRLSGLIINTAAFRWNTTLNYGYNKNEVTKVDFPQKTVGSYLASVAQVGQPLNYLFSYRWAGLSSAGAPRVYDEKGQIVDYKTDLANPLALLYEGTTTPPHYGALINEFTYKRFSLLTNFAYKMGHVFRIPVIKYEGISESSSQVFKDWDNRWKQPGDEVYTNIPAAPKAISGLNVYDKYVQNADVNVQTASTIRFRELLLNYALPVTLFKNRTGSNCSVGLQIRNLAVYTFNKEGLDPEYMTTDANNIVLPLRPEYSFIIRANF